MWKLVQHMVSIVLVLALVIVTLLVLWFFLCGRFCCVRRLLQRGRE